MTTRLTDTARMCHRLPEDALAQAFARLPVDVFAQVTNAVAEVLMDDLDRLLEMTRQYR